MSLENIVKRNYGELLFGSSGLEAQIEDLKNKLETLSKSYDKVVADNVDLDRQISELLDKYEPISDNNEDDAIYSVVE